MLPLGFRRAHRSANSVIQAPQLALGAAIHIAHANHYGMRLIIQIQAVGNQLLQFDLGETFKRSSTAATGPAFRPASARTAIGTSTFAARAALTAATAFATILARGA